MDAYIIQCRRFSSTDGSHGHQSLARSQTGHGLRSSEHSYPKDLKVTKHGPECRQISGSSCSLLPGGDTLASAVTQTKESRKGQLIAAAASVHMTAVREEGGRENCGHKA